MATKRINKAYTATVNRIAQRYGGKSDESQEFDVIAPEFTVQVATTAIVTEAVEKLRRHGAPAYVAMTNREGVKEAIRATEGTPVGVMDPSGDIVKPASAEQA